MISSWHGELLPNIRAAVHCHDRIKDGLNKDFFDRAYRWVMASKARHQFISQPTVCKGCEGGALLSECFSIKGKKKDRWEYVPASLFLLLLLFTYFSI